VHFMFAGTEPASLASFQADRPARKATGAVMQSRLETGLVTRKRPSPFAACSDIRFSTI